MGAKPRLHLHDNHGRKKERKSLKRGGGEGEKKEKIAVFNCRRLGPTLLFFFFNFFIYFFIKLFTL